MIKEQQNGWFRVGDYGFAKKLRNDTYEVFRLVNLEDFTYVEWYNKVDISIVDEKWFNKYGDYNEYIQLQTDIEKAVYVAVFSLTYDDYVKCDNEQEIKEILVFNGVINENENFSSLIF